MQEFEPIVDAVYKITDQTKEVKCKSTDNIKNAPTLKQIASKYLKPTWVKINSKLDSEEGETTYYSSNEDDSSDETIIGEELNLSSDVLNRNRSVYNRVSSNAEFVINSPETNVFMKGNEFLSHCASVKSGGMKKRLCKSEHTLKHHIGLSRSNTRNRTWITRTQNSEVSGNFFMSHNFQNDTCIDLSTSKNIPSYNTEDKASELYIRRNVSDLVKYFEASLPYNFMGATSHVKEQQKAGGDDCGSRQSVVISTATQTSKMQNPISPSPTRSNPMEIHDTTSCVDAEQDSESKEDNFLLVQEKKRTSFKVQNSVELAKTLSFLNIYWILLCATMLLFQVVYQQTYA